MLAQNRAHSRQLGRAATITEATSAASHPAAKAYAELLDEIEAVPEAELIPIRIDVIAAVTTVLGTLPEVRALREAIGENLKRFDFQRFDKLEKYARALHHAHVLWRASSLPKAEVSRLADELNDVRDRLLKSAETLAAFGLVDAERLKDIKKLPGYRPLAIDVATIVEVIRERWAVVQGKTPLSLADLDRHAAQALDLLAGVGLKEQAPPTTGAAALTRQRAFTLFERSYNEARRAVLYLRPDDVDEVAPSIYAGRGGRGTGADSPSAEQPGEAPATSSDRSGQKASADNEPPARINNPTGLPATPPFTS